jgi:molecular chaperone DnaK (HSP70)
MSARYAVGIDLGTTNSAVSYIDLTEPVPAGRPPQIRTFAVPQLVSEGNVADRPLLPSFLYQAGAHDLPPGSTRLPWDEGRTYAVGEFARNQGAKVPGRLVSSAKSWLCHSAVDRTAAILPWGGSTDVPKVSPVEASARYLAHMREAWNHKMAPGGEPTLKLEAQDIVLTVPASFDAVARELTVEAARKAGLGKVTLLEEPQAAFYWWIVAHFESWWDHVKPGQLVLVCDVGGGTTDFSLIAVTEGKKGLGFERFAVGDHLILGGDNMDIALARSVEGRLSGGGKPAKLDIVQWAGLVQACRAAKEKILSGAADKVPVVLAGRGSALIGGSLRTELTRAEVEAVILDGFFPAVGWEEDPVRAGRSGLQEFGLPYTPDAAIPKHLSVFLRRHLAGEGGKGVGTRGRVGAVLFNGGVFNPPVVRNRLMEVLRRWMGESVPFGDMVSATVESPQGLNLAVLENAALDLAVAHGAAYYGLVRKGKGIRIGGGTARSYYIGVAGGDGAVEPAAEPASVTPDPSASEGRAEPATALRDPSAARTTVLCVAPAGLDEGQEVEIADRQFELLTGRPVSFPLFSSSLRPRDKSGQILVAEDESLVPLAPIHTVLSAGKKGGGAKTTPVHLRAKVTEVGTLELYCVSRLSERSWRLQFQVRDPLKTDPAARADAEADLSETAVEAGVALPEELVVAACDAVRLAYGLPAKGDPAAAGAAVPPAGLTKRLEELLEAKRDSWPTSALRRLWEPLAEAIEARKISPEAEARWLNLAGFCLRPGFGDPLDEWRLKRLWSINYSGLAHFKNPQNWVEWWTLWRRVSGGLTAAWQNEVFHEVGGYLHPSLKRGKGPKPGRPKPTGHETAEQWRLAASLERLDPATKEKIGAAVFAETPAGLPPKPQTAALARLGARRPLYGPLNAVVPRTTAEGWIARVLSADWAADPDGAAFAVAQMARMTGDRAIDIDDAMRAKVIDRLSAGGPGRYDHLLKLVAEVAELRAEDRTQLLGDQLPAGLRLVNG